MKGVNFFWRKIGTAPILFGMVVVIEKKVSIGKDVEDLPIIEIKGGGMRMGKGQRYALALMEAESLRRIVPLRQEG